jgi:Holliday junction resolvase RusA-like endonuclease
MEIKCEISVRPAGKARARITKYGAYTPAKTKNLQNLISYELNIASSVSLYRDQLPFKKPVTLVIQAHFLNPKIKNFEITPRIKKPDSDNILKLVSDAIPKSIILDDKQIFCMSIQKYDSYKDSIIIYLTDIIK